MIGKYNGSAKPEGYSFEGAPLIMSEKDKKWEALAEGNRSSYFMVFDENDTGLDGAMTVAAFMGIMRRL